MVLAVTADVFESSPGSLFVIFVVAVLSPLLSAAIGWVKVSPLVFEILGGILIGPAVLDFVEITEPITLLSNLGLATLIFLAGFEIDPARMRGRPLKLAATGWVVSIVLGLAAAGILLATGVIEAELYVAFALTTTALGTLLPMARDAGLVETPFGTHLLAIGTVGEFGPILAIALVLSGASATKAVEALVIFAVVAAVALVTAGRVTSGRFHKMMSRTLETSGQLHARFALLLIVAMALVAAELGLDFLLGAFTAGIVFRLVLRGGFRTEEIEKVESKVDAVAFGVLIPIFFVVTGVKFDLDALADPVALAKLALFIILLLVVRGIPVYFLYRADLPEPRTRWSLAFLAATGLPLIVAIAEIGVSADLMTTSTSAALIGAGMVSVVLYPIIGMRLAPEPPGGPEPPDDEGSEPLASEETP